MNDSSWPIGLLGVVIAIAMRQALWRSEGTTLYKIISVVLIAGATGAGVYVGAYVQNVFFIQPARQQSFVETLIANTRLSAVVADHPSIRERLLVASRSGDPALVRRTLVEARTSYVIPAIRNAPEANIEALYKSTVTLVEHLARTSIRDCADFGYETIRNVEALDAIGQRLFIQLLDVQSQAYLAGRNQPTQRMIDAETLVDFLITGGFDETSIRALANRPGDDVAACRIVQQLYSPRFTGLPGWQRFARFVVAPPQD